MSVRCANPKAIPEACKEAVLDSLLNNLSARLSGRGEFYPVIYRDKPSAVLMSEFLLPMPQEERDNDEEADPIRISSHGIDFQIDRAAQDTPIEIRVRGAVYVRILPRAEELAPGAILEAKFPLTREIRRPHPGAAHEASRRARHDGQGLANASRLAHPQYGRETQGPREPQHPV